MITNAKLVVVEVSLPFTGWRHYFPELIQLNYGLMFRMKWLWLLPNLVKIYSIFLNLLAIKQSGPILAYPIHRESKKGRRYTLVHIFAKYW